MTYSFLEWKELVNQREIWSTKGEGFPLVFSLLLAPLILLCRKMFLMLFRDSLGYTKIKSIPFLFEDVSYNFWIYTKLFLLSCEVPRTLANRRVSSPMFLQFFRNA